MALLPLAAQSVSGTVTDEKNLPLEEITVVALQAPDSLYITGGVTNGNGEFHIRISHSGKYMLKLSGIGFQTKYIADGYFVLPYTIQNYLADQALWPHLDTNSPEFEEAENGVKAEIIAL